jgi:hypothetical protein
MSFCCVGTSPQESDELFKSIILEWVLIRGHSLASKYIEEYKTLEATAKKGLRRQLRLDDVK